MIIALIFVFVLSIEGITLKRENASNLSVYRGCASAASTIVNNKMITIVGSSCAETYGIINADVYFEKKRVGNPHKLIVPRGNAAGISVDTLLCIVGGTAYDNLQWKTTRAIDCYDAETQTWNIANKTGLQISRADGIAAASMGNYATFWGGLSDYGIATNTIEIHEVKDKNLEFKKILHLPQKKGISHMGVTTIGNLIVGAGGMTGTWRTTFNLTKDIAILDMDKLEIYIPYYGGRKVTLSEEQGGLSAATVGNYIFFLGGYNLTNVPSTNINVFAVFDNILKPIICSNLHKARYGPGVFALSNRAIVVAGGGDGNGIIYDSVEILDIHNMSWSFGPPLLEPSFNPAVGVVGNQALVAGGIYQIAELNKAYMYSLES